MRFAMVSVGVNVVLALSLFPFIDERGIATADGRAPAGSTPRCCSSRWSGAAIGIATRGLLRRLPRLVFAAAAMGVGLHFGAQLALRPWLEPDSSLLQQVSALSALVAGGGLLYLALAFGTGGARSCHVAPEHAPQGRAGRPPPEQGDA